MNPTPIRLGISTCPNDTFAFHGLLNDRIDRRGLEFQIELLDIQELNDGLMHGRFDVAKCSFHAALLLSDSMIVLPSGSALGFGVGPLLLSARPHELPRDAQQVTLCPGEHTTATLLFKLFYPQTTELRQTVFSEIMPALQNGEADFGVCIHEGRFTWQDQGLGLVEDLGTRWEHDTDCPLPLGGLVARRDWSAGKLAAIQAVVRDSILYGLAHRDETAATMRRYAQEFSDDVLYQHVDLYVNDWTVDLGDLGAKALAQLNAKARASGLVTGHKKPLEILSHGCG